MAEIIQVNGRPVIDYMARDYESLLNAMRALVPSKLPEWTDFANEADFGNVLLELFAHMGDILSYYQDRVANESFLGTAQSRRSIIQHLRLIGYTLGTAAPAAGSLAVTVPGSFTGTVTVAQGDAFATRSQKNKPSVRFEYTGQDPLTLDFGGPDVSTFPKTSARSYVAVDPKTGARTCYVVDPKTGRPTSACLPVEEGRLIKDEILGVSDGSANQRFTLARPGLILRQGGLGQKAAPDIVVVSSAGNVPGGTLGSTVDRWTLQESLAFSRAGQSDYVVEIDENDQAAVSFGDGALGKIPDKGAVIRATYRVGGGLAGNVPANAIVSIVSAPQLTQIGARVTNPGRATGGAERESIQHAVAHAPAVFRSLRRAVTAADYEALASSLKGVGKVRAAATSWNTVTLSVAPEGGGKVSDVLEANLLAFFADKRILGQNVEIADVDYVPIYVTAQVGVQSYYSRDDVAARVQAAAAGLLAFDNVGFAQSVYLSRFYDVMEEIPGVLYVNITEFRRPNQADLVEPSGKITLAVDEIPVIPGEVEYQAGVKVIITEGGY